MTDSNLRVAEWVSFTVPQGAFNALRDASEQGVLSSVLTA